MQLHSWSQLSYPFNILFANKCQPDSLANDCKNIIVSCDWHCRAKSGLTLNMIRAQIISPNIFLAVPPWLTFQLGRKRPQLFWASCLPCTYVVERKREPDFWNSQNTELPSVNSFEKGVYWVDCWSWVVCFTWGKNQSLFLVKYGFTEVARLLREKGARRLGTS